MSLDVWRVWLVNDTAQLSVLALYTFAENVMTRTAGQLVDRAVAAANALSAEWARHHCTGESTVMAGAGIWPLLAILAGSAADEARSELEAAVGLSGAEGFEAAKAVLRLLNSSAAARLAFGIWVKAEVPILAEWQESMPVEACGRLVGDGSDQKRLDRWAAHHTERLIPGMPLAIGPEALMVLATACLVRTRWLRGFKVGDFELDAQAGPWADRSNIAVLERETPDLDDLLVSNGYSAGQMTLVEVRGQHDISVFLVTAGETSRAGDVLADAIRAICDPGSSRRGSSLHPGESAPGVSVEIVPGRTSEPTLSLRTVPFQLQTSHDLLKHAALFGLVSATDQSRGHFPRISLVPLAVSAAAQTAMAAFSPHGFKAAAVTEVEIYFAGAPPRLSRRRINVTVSFDRPFGFVAVHRACRLVLVAGWVSDPQLIISGDNPRWPPFSQSQQGLEPSGNA